MCIDVNPSKLPLKKVDQDQESMTHQDQEFSSTRGKNDEAHLALAAILSDRNTHFLCLPSLSHQKRGHIEHKSILSDFFSPEHVISSG